MIPILFYTGTSAALLIAGLLLSGPAGWLACFGVFLATVAMAICAGRGEKI